jgi:hypothetical protein
MLITEDTENTEKVQEMYLLNLRELALICPAAKLYLPPVLFQFGFFSVRSVSSVIHTEIGDSWRRT